MSGIQMEFTTQQTRKVCFCTINRLFQGYSIVIHRCNLETEDVDVRQYGFIQNLLDWSIKTTLKITFKSYGEAKKYIKEKSIDGAFVLFDLKNRPPNQKNNRRIELITQGKLESMMLEYARSLENLNNLFTKNLE